MATDTGDDTSSSGPSLVVEVTAHGAKASVPPKLFADIGPVLKYSVLLLSLAAAVAIVLSSAAIVVRAWR